MSNNDSIDRDVVKDGREASVSVRPVMDPAHTSVGYSGYYAQEKAHLDTGAYSYVSPAPSDPTAPTPVYQQLTDSNQQLEAPSSPYIGHMEPLVTATRATQESERDSDNVAVLESTSTAAETAQPKDHVTDNTAQTSEHSSAQEPTVNSSTEHSVVSVDQIPQTSYKVNGPEESVEHVEAAGTSCSTAPFKCEGLNGSEEFVDYAEQAGTSSSTAAVCDNAPVLMETNDHMEGTADEGVKELGRIVIGQSSDEDDDFDEEESEEVIEARKKELAHDNMLHFILDMEHNYDPRDPSRRYRKDLDLDYGPNSFPIIGGIGPDLIKETRNLHVSPQANRQPDISGVPTRRFDGSSPPKVPHVYRPPQSIAASVGSAPKQMIPMRSDVTTIHSGQVVSRGRNLPPNARYTTYTTPMGAPGRSATTTITPKPLTPGQRFQTLTTGSSMMDSQPPPPLSRPEPPPHRHLEGHMQTIPSAPERQQHRMPEGPHGAAPMVISAGSGRPFTARAPQFSVAGKYPHLADSRVHRKSYVEEEGMVEQAQGSRSPHPHEARSQQPHDARLQQAHDARSQQAHEVRPQQPHEARHPHPHDARLQQQHEARPQQQHEARLQQQHEARHPHAHQSSLRRDFVAPPPAHQTASPMRRLSPPKTPQKIEPPHRALLAKPQGCSAPAPSARRPAILGGRSQLSLPTAPSTPSTSVATPVTATPPVTHTSTTAPTRVIQDTRPVDGLPDEIMEPPTQPMVVHTEPPPVLAPQPEHKSPKKDSGVLPEHVVDIAMSVMQTMPPAGTTVATPTDTALTEADIKEKIQMISIEIAKEMAQKEKEKEDKEKLEKSRKAITSPHRGRHPRQHIQSPVHVPDRERTISSSSIASAPRVSSPQRAVGRPPTKRAVASPQVRLRSPASNVVPVQVHGTRSRAEKLVNGPSSTTADDDIEILSDPEDWGAEDYTTNCICGTTHCMSEMIQCGICEAWQHMHCMGINIQGEYDNDDYTCSVCTPRETMSRVEALSLITKVVKMKAQRRMLKKKKKRRSSSTKRGRAVTPEPPTMLNVYENQYSSRARQLIHLMGNTMGAQTFMDKISKQESKAKALYVAPDVEGLVACGPITKGDIIIEYVGKVMLPDEIGREEGHVLQYVVLYDGLPEPDVPQEKRGESYIVIDARKFAAESRTVRRSCQPNSHLRHVILEGKIHVLLVASENIARNLEVTVPFDVDHHFTQVPLVCACDEGAACPIQKLPQINFMPRRAVGSPSPPEHKRVGQSGKPESASVTKTKNSSVKSRRRGRSNTAVTANTSDIELATPKTTDRRNRRKSKVEAANENEDSSLDETTGSNAGETVKSTRRGRLSTKNTTPVIVASKELKQGKSGKKEEAEKEKLERKIKTEKKPERKEKLVKQENPEKKETPEKKEHAEKKVKSEKKDKQENIENGHIDGINKSDERSSNPTRRTSRTVIAPSELERVNYTLPSDRVKMGREERKALELEKLFQKSEKSEKRKDNEDTNKPFKPKKTSKTAEKEVLESTRSRTRRQSEADEMKNNKKKEEEEQQQPSHNDQQRKRKTHDRENDETATPIPPRKRWAASVAASPPSSASAADTPSDTRSTSSAARTGDQKKLWIKKFQAEEKNRKSEETPSISSSASPSKRRRGGAENLKQVSLADQMRAAIDLAVQSRRLVSRPYELPWVVPSAKPTGRRRAQTVAGSTQAIVTPHASKAVVNARSSGRSPARSPRVSITQATIDDEPSTSTSSPVFPAMEETPKEPEKKQKRLSMEDYKAKRRSGVSGASTSAESTSQVEATEKPEKKSGFIPSMDQVPEDVSLPVPVLPSNSPTKTNTSPDSLDQLKKNIYGVKDLPPPPIPPRLGSPVTPGETSIEEEQKRSMSVADRLKTEFGSSFFSEKK